MTEYTGKTSQEFSCKFGKRKGWITEGGIKVEPCPDCGRVYKGVYDSKTLQIDVFEVIYADPPWRYSFSKSDSRKIERQYLTMPLDEICDLSVPAAPNSVLYLWATAPKLIEALRVMEAWGFQYKSHAIWDKELLGMGYWFRGRHELLLVGTKGKFSPPKQEFRIASVYKERRGKHSKKPTAIRDMISLWYPDKSKIELFAREEADGWFSWGNEIMEVSQ